MAAANEGLFLNDTELTIEVANEGFYLNITEVTIGATNVASLASRLGFGFVLSLLTLGGTVGNLLVVTAIGTDQKLRRSPMNRLLANLAIADLGNLLACVPDWLQQIIFGDKLWMTALLPACAPLRYLQIFFLYSSVLTQVVVCIERYVAIAHPLQVRTLCSSRATLLTLAFCWSLSAVFALPYLLFHQGQIEDHHCHLQFPQPAVLYIGFKSAECICFYFVPLLLLSLLYWRISRLLWRPPSMALANWTREDRRSQGRRTSSRQGSALHSLRNLPALCTPLMLPAMGLREAFVIGGRKSAVATRRKVIQMLLACVLVYFVCYSPIQAIFVSHSLFHRKLLPEHSPFEYEMTLILNTLATASSACNPVIYTLFYEKFRVRFVEILCCRPQRTISELPTGRQSSCQNMQMQSLIAGRSRLNSDAASRHDAVDVRRKLTEPPRIVNSIGKQSPFLSPLSPVNDKQEEEK